MDRLLLWRAVAPAKAAKDDGKIDVPEEGKHKLKLIAVGNVDEALVVALEKDSAVPEGKST